tara:strand:- start:2127 stop:2846 length:720 start_codon:yes stop_codon:yes gene_type:complete
MTYQIILVRHGKSVWNVKNIFTGWVDVELDNIGISEAEKSGQLIKQNQINPTYCFTSFLSRAQKTLKIILDEMRLENLEIEKAWQLNERHYGALQGLNKDEVKKKYGEEQFLKWRRGYDTPPPELDQNNDMNPINDQLYEGIDNLPLSECLKDTYERVIPFWENSIVPLLSNNVVLISAHGNSLRALCKKLFNITDEDIVNLEIPTGNPLLINLNKSCKIISASYLDRSRAEILPRILE